MKKESPEGAPSEGGCPSEGAWGCLPDIVGLVERVFQQSASTLSSCLPR